MRTAILLCTCAVLLAAEQPDASPMVEAIEQVRKLAHLRCTYVVQTGWSQNRVIPLRLDASIRDNVMYRLAWSSWPTDLALPAGAVAGQRADKDAGDVRRNGVQVATTRNQHQVLDEATGEMSIWSFAPFDAAKGLALEDTRLSGSLAIAQGYGFDIPWFSPVSVVYSVVHDRNFNANGLIGLSLLALAPADLKKAVTAMCQERKQLPDGRVALFFANKKTMLSQWHVLRRNPECANAWVVDEVRYPDAHQTFEQAAEWVRTYTYVPVVIGGRPIPLVATINTPTAAPLSPTWDQTVLASYTVDEKMRESEVSIDASEAKRVIDKAVGMEREK